MARFDRRDSIQLYRSYKELDIQKHLDQHPDSSTQPKALHLYPGRWLE